MRPLPRLLPIAVVALLLAAGGWWWHTAPARAVTAAAPWSAPTWSTLAALARWDIDPFPAAAPTQPGFAGAQLHDLLSPLDGREQGALRPPIRSRLDSVWTPGTRALLARDVGVALTPEGLQDLLGRALDDSVSSPALQAIATMPFHHRAGRFAALGSVRTIDVPGARYAMTAPPSPDSALAAATLTDEAIRDMAAAWFLTATYQRGMRQVRPTLEVLGQGTWAMALWARGTPDPREAALAAAWGDAFVTSFLATLRQLRDSSFATRAAARWATLRETAPQATGPSPWLRPTAALAAAAAFPVSPDSPLSAIWYRHVAGQIAAACGGGPAPDTDLRSLPGMSSVPPWVRASWEAALTPPSGWWARQAWCRRLPGRLPWSHLGEP